MIAGHHTVLAKRKNWESCKHRSSSNPQPAIPCKAWHGSGGARGHEQPWAESFREQTRTQRCRPTVAAAPSQVPYTVSDLWLSV